MTKKIILTLAFLLIAVACYATDATNTVANVVSTLSAANAISAPFNPYAGLISGLLQVGGPLAMFLAGVFSHKSGVNVGKDTRK